MSILSSKFRKLLIIVVSLCVALSLSGCGGGTSGTGGNDVLARLIEVGGAALTNVQVSVLETGEQTVTNAEGKFELSLPKDKKSTLLFDSDKGSAQAEIDPELFPAEKVTIEFVAAKDLSVVTVNKIEATDAGTAEDDAEKEGPRTRTKRLRGTGSGIAPKGFELVLNANFKEVTDKAGVLSRELELTGTIPVGFTVNEERLAAVLFTVRFPEGGRCQLIYQNSDGTNGIFKLSLSVSRGADGNLAEKAESEDCKNFAPLNISRGQRLGANITRLKMNGYWSIPIVFVVEMDRK
jgi:hypothetical protein